MKPAIVSAVLAWTVGFLSIVIFVCIAGLWRVLSGGALHEGDHIWLALVSIFFVLLAWAVGLAVVVFPTCLFVVTPLLRFLPRSSPLWRPSFAAVVGAVAGPVAMYLWSVGFRLQFYIPDPLDGPQVPFTIVSILVGATFGYLYATSVRSSVPNHALQRTGRGGGVPPEFDY